MSLSSHLPASGRRQPGGDCEAQRGDQASVCATERDGEEAPGGTGETSGPFWFFFFHGMGNSTPFPVCSHDSLLCCSLVPVIILIIWWFHPSSNDPPLFGSLLCGLSVRSCRDMALTHSLPLLFALHNERPICFLPQPPVICRVW